MENKPQHCATCKSFVEEKEGKCVFCGTHVSAEKKKERLRQLANKVTRVYKGVNKDVF